MLWLWHAKTVRGGIKNGPPKIESRPVAAQGNKPPEKFGKPEKLRLGHPLMKVGVGWWVDSFGCCATHTVTP